MIPKLIPATIDDYPVIQNMARFYVYEMSRECGLNSTDWVCPADGLYESFDFKHYLTDSDRQAYLIKVNEELAGFVLIYQTGEQPNAQWNIGEFFILVRFQRRGIGRLAAQQVWQHHPGSWEVTVIPENQRALKFWRKAINHNFAEEVKPKKGRVDPDQPNRIFLTFNTKRTRASLDRPTIQIKRASIQQQSVIFITTPDEQFNAEMEQGLIANIENLNGVAEGSKRHTIYAQENQKIIGGIITYLHGTILWIDSIYVDKSRRQQGLGKMLVEQITAYAKKCGAAELQLNTYFHEAHHFFSDQGFEILCSIQNWKYGLTCYLMSKFI